MNKAFSKGISINTKMNQQKAFNMNRNTYNRERRADGSDRTNTATTNPNPHYNRSPNNSRDNHNHNHNRNPFNNNRSQHRQDGGGYQRWKHTQPPPAPPKEKVLGPEDFPALPSAAPTTRHIPDSSAWSKPEVTIADKMKEIQEKEEEAKRTGRSLIEKEEDKIDVIPLSAWMRAKYLAKKREEDERRREIEAEEENYRWQISKAMFPPKPEPEVPVYDENADIYDEELESPAFEYQADEAPVYEERI